MMRLLVHGLAGYTKGGIETFVLGMAEHMSDEIIFDYVIEKDTTGENVKLPGRGDTIMMEPKRKMLANLKSWSKLLREREIVDSAVYFNWYSMAWLFPAMIARARCYKVIIHAHNNNLHNCSILQRTMHVVNRQLQKFMKIKRLTNSELSARFFFGSKPVEMIYNAIDVEKFAFNQDIRDKLRESLGVKNKHVYGFAGRIVYQKNPLFLMEIFRRIRERDNRASFLVCGDGDLMGETTKMADEYGLDVRFVGSVSNIRDYYQAMDVFVLPSRFEGLGIVLIEAQCCGLPCVASADVIPQDAKVTELLEYIPLSEPNKWVDTAIEMAKRKIERDKYRSIIADSRFNIETEAKRLENYLRGK